MAVDDLKPVSRFNAEPKKFPQAHQPDDIKEKSFIMVKGNLQLTIKERLMLELIMLSPIFICLTILYTTESFLLTLIAFHVVLTYSALRFLKYKNVKISWRGLIKQDLRRNPRRLNNDIKLMIAPIVMIIGTYIWFRNTFPDFNYDAMRLPPLQDTFVIILLFIEFVFINPIVEELFWRFFCELFTGQGKTLLNKLDVCFHFGLYHWFVAYFFCLHIPLSTAGCMGVMVLGFILTIIKDKAGLITAMIVHLGVDVSAVIAIWDLQTKSIPLY